MNRSLRRSWLPMLCSALLLLSPDSSHAQISYAPRPAMSAWSISATYSLGILYKHTPRFEPTIDHPAQAFELAISKQLHGRQVWEQVHHYPWLGVAGAIHDLANDSVLGTAYSILPFIEIPMFRIKGIGAYFRVGSGLAYLTKHYDAESNPLNNAIASHVNDITQFMMELSWQPDPRLTIKAGGSATHYSSGAIRVPNLGINFLMLRAGLTYTPYPLHPVDFIHNRLPSIPSKLLFTLQPGLGFQEMAPAHGPMFHVYQLEFSTGKMIRRWDLLSLGFQANYKEAASTFIRQEEIYPDHYFIHSMAAAGYLKNDFLFGNIGISFYLGDYFYHPSPLQIAFFQKLGTFYAFPLGHHPSLKRLTAGVYITAGNFTADFVSLETGFRF